MPGWPDMLDSPPHQGDRGGPQRGPPSRWEGAEGGQRLSYEGANEPSPQRRQPPQPLLAPPLPAQAADAAVDAGTAWARAVSAELRDALAELRDALAESHAELQAQRVQQAASGGGGGPSIPPAVAPLQQQSAPMQPVRLVSPARVLPHRWLLI